MRSATSVSVIFFFASLNGFVISENVSVVIFFMITASSWVKKSTRVPSLSFSSLLISAGIAICPLELMLPIPIVSASIKTTCLQDK